jgi:hypothetical protein
MRADLRCDDYANAGGQRRTYAKRGSQLVQIIAAGERPLISLSDASFGYEGLSATVTFARDRSGRVVAAEESRRVGFVRFARANR